jgi:ABC-2 type transport system permease protein
MSRWPSTIKLLPAQIRYQLLMLWRTPVALFFTLVLPLMMLVLFNSLFGDAKIQLEGGGEWPVRQFYTGGLAVFTAVSATFTNLANMVPIRREEGVLKRWRGTPLPTGTYISGFIGSALVLAVFGASFMLGIGVVAYGLEVEAAKLPAAVLAFVVGVCAFAAMGMAVAALVPSASSASAVANAILLPLAFVSNVFIVTEDSPGWMEAVGDFFPLKPFVESFQDAFNPFVEAPAFNWGKLGYVAIWGLVGLAVAVKFFKWEPSVGGQTTRRRRAARQAAATIGD